MRRLFIVSSVNRHCWRLSRWRCTFINRSAFREEARVKAGSLSSALLSINNAPPVSPFEASLSALL